MTITTDRALWIDADYDRDRASDGSSRYGAYVRQHLDSFAECWDGTFEEDLKVHFAETAWRVATGPIMVPGYVRCHRRIMRTELAYSYWDGSLLAAVDLVTPWPAPLTESRQWMEQSGRGRWSDWLVEFGDALCEPSDQDLAKGPFLLTTSSLRLAVPDGQLPLPPSARQAPHDLADLARQAVATAVREIDRVVRPVIEALEHR